MTTTQALTPDELAFYHENGYVILDPVFDDDELETLGRAADELGKRSGPLVPDSPRVRLEEETVGGRLIIRKIEPIIDVVPALKELVNDPRMTGPAAQIFEEDVYLFEDKLNYKPPFVGEKYFLHQDYAYWQNYTDRLITVTLLLDDATPENGCLRFVPGSHKKGLIPRENDDPRIIQRNVDPSVAVDAPGLAGGLVVFSCYTAHHSYDNLTDKGRRVILYTYNPVSEGDTYPTYKGFEGQKCREWQAQKTVQ